MRFSIQHAFTGLLLFLWPVLNYGQAPDLGVASSFAVFTAVGAFSNDGATVVTGDIGTNVGSFTGFPPGTVIGQIHVADVISAAAATDVQEAYAFLDALTCGTVIGVTLGNGQILTPDIYCIGAAATINGNLVLDAQGDPDAIFIFQIDGALGTSTLSSVTLINGASICNVYWQVNGAFTLGEGSVFRGTLIANGAIHLLEGSSLEGRALSQSGAIDLHNNIVNIGSTAVAPIIVADGPTTFCAGDSVILSGNIDGTWSTGDTTSSITVTTSGDYFVVNTTLCGSDTSNLINVTVGPGGAPSITCPADISVECDESTLPANTGTATASDNCNTPLTTSFTDVITPGTCPQEYTIGRTWSATDSSGNTITCIQSIAIEDNTPPVITCPSNVTLDCTASTSPASNGVATAIENCDTPPNVSFSDAIVAGSCAADYTILRTWTATNECGSTSTCVQSLTIQGTGTISIVCPANITVSCAADVPAVNPGAITASDNCAGAITVTHQGDVISLQTCANQYILTRTYMATDACNNTVTCTQLITVADIIIPVITFTHPLLVGVPNGGTISVQCFGQNEDWDLPLFDSGSVSAADNCTGTVNVTFSQTLENQGDCEEDGYINLYRLTWNATDVCGNSSSAFAFLALTDTIPPVIHGVPVDITVSCSALPAFADSVYATDECLCACVMLTATSALAPGCQDGQVMTRSWSSTDACGNVTVVTQNITFVDDEAPAMQLLLTGMSNIHDGDIFEFACSQGGIPVSFDQLNEASMSNLSSCGGAATVSFNRDIEISNNCELSGYIEQHIFSWESVDLCANVSSMSITVRLIDDEAPVLTGVPGTVCIGDPSLSNVSALDNCSEATLLFSDFNVPNPCGSGMAIRRTYEANDACGNISVATTIIIPNDQTQPVIAFVNPIFINLPPEVPVTVNCANNGQNYTSFGIHDIRVEDACLLGTTVDFTEKLISTGDCMTDGFVAVVELTWTATDLCGNQSVLKMNANVVDESFPVFINFRPEITIGCNDELPQVNTSDNCGEVTIVTNDVIIAGECEFVYDIQRSIILTDACGNTTTREQIIHVGNASGPRIDGVEEEICDDLTIPVVTAYDECAEQFVEVTMRQDTLEAPCSEGLVIRRTWTAVGICGIVTEIHQTIIINDQTPPEILITSYSVVNLFTENDFYRILMSQVDLIDKLNALDENSVFFMDDCDQEIIPVFSVDTTFSADCLADGYSERRTYTWSATDACGNVSILTFNIDIVDDIPPVFTGNPSDTTIVCVPLSSIPLVLAQDLSQPVTVVYSETMVPGNEPGVFIITRRWIATDACGNISETVQVITWIPDTFLECNIIVPPSFECNSHGIVISSDVTGGTGPYEYVWEIVGEKCFIQGGQGTPDVTIYVGWSDVKIILTVTDAFDCVTMCMIVLSCLEPGELSISAIPASLDPVSSQDVINQINATGVVINSEELVTKLNVWPNPANETLNFSFVSANDQQIEYNLINILGQIASSGQIDSRKGLITEKIDITHLPGGSYMLQVRLDKESLSRNINILR